MSIQTAREMMDQLATIHDRASSIAMRVGGQVLHDRIQQTTVKLRNAIEDMLWELHRESLPNLTALKFEMPMVYTDKVLKRLEGVEITVVAKATEDQANEWLAGPSKFAWRCIVSSGQYEGFEFVLPDTVVRGVLISKAEEAEDVSL